MTLCIIIPVTNQPSTANYDIYGSVRLVQQVILIATLMLFMSLKKKNPGDITITN